MSESHGHASDGASKAGSSTAKSAWYVLVRSHTEGFELYNRMKADGIPARIAPAPHGLQACCGMSLMLDEEHVEDARRFIEEASFPIERIVEVDNAIDPKRDRYC